MLCRSNFVMLGLGRYAKLPKLGIHVTHECCDTLTDSTEVVIVHLLTLRRHCSD